jgi:hypothetical protein
VAGSSVNGTGVIGSTDGNGQSGVAGFDDSPGGAYGVTGQSRVGGGVYGLGTSGAYGVSGESTIGTGVIGSSPSGIGVLAQSQLGFALQTQGLAQFNGIVQFNGTSGVVTVKKGAKTATVKVKGMTKSNIVLATIQEPQAGISLEGAKAATGSFTLTLSAAPTAGLPVGWLVIG